VRVVFQMAAAQEGRGHAEGLNTLQGSGFGFRV
jgi:hypothetical protein